MAREKEFFDFMENFFEMTRYVSVFQSTLYNYYDMKLYITEVHALNKIYAQEKINMTQLAQLVHRTKGAVSQMIAKLEKMGLVIKKISATNKSEILLELTDKGRKVCEYHHSAEERIYRLYLESMEDFTQEDFEKANKLMARILDVTIEKTK